MAACLITTEKVNHFIKVLKGWSCKINRNKEAGVVEAFEGNISVFLAIQKGLNQPWIARFVDGETVKWTEVGINPRCDICDRMLPMDHKSKNCFLCNKAIIANSVPSGEDE